MTIAVQPAVDLLMEARARRRLVAPLSETDPELSIANAYAIQDALRTALEQKGNRTIGWKLAFTSPEGQAAMGVNEATAGFLLSEQYPSGSDISLSQFANLGVEVEIAFRIRSELAGPGVTSEVALNAVEGVMPALELPDFLFSGKPRAADFIADSIHARAISLGSLLTPVRDLDLSLEGVVYEHNGQIVATHTAAEVMGNPLNALAWLANHLATRGLALKPGDVVMTGSISRILRPKAGDTIRARFTHVGSVSVKIFP